MHAPESKSDLAPAIEMEPAAITYQHPEQSALSEAADRVLIVAKSFVIDSPDMATIAAEELAKIKGHIKRLDDERKSITKPMDEAKKNVMDIYKPALETFGQAETFLKQAILNFQQEEDRKARIAAAERERIAAAERAKLEVKAEKLEARGKDSSAVRLQAELVSVAPVVTPAPVKLSGTSSRSVWKAKVTDKLALVKYIAENPSWLHLLDVSESAIGAQAKAMKTASPIPGLEFYEEKVLSARAA